MPKGVHKTTYTIRALVWLYQGASTAAGGAWHFVTLPKKDAADIKKRFGTKRPGWGSIPVAVTIGSTTWKTSIFPDKKSESYLLPLKAQIRRREGISAGDTVRLRLDM